jgi:hypothetical protein
MSGKIHLSVIILVVSLLFIHCNPRFQIPRDEITLSTENIRNDVRMVIALISEDQYSRLYNEVLSQSLQESTSVSELKSTFENFENEYGRLVLSDSRIMNHSVMDGGIHLITYIIQYKERTIFAEFTFSGDQDNLRMVNYVFED